MIALQVITILLILIGLSQTHHFKRKIMSKITAFAAAVSASFAAINQSVSGIQTDITSLKAQIEALQNSPGEISAEDQATLDAIQATAETVASKLAALDGLTPPEAPAPEAEADSGTADNGESL